jgi:hypothetical protein
MFSSLSLDWQIPPVIADIAANQAKLERAVVNGEGEVDLPSVCFSCRIQRVRGFFAALHFPHDDCAQKNNLPHRLYSRFLYNQPRNSHSVLSTTRLPITVITALTTTVAGWRVLLMRAATATFSSI